MAFLEKIDEMNNRQRLLVLVVIVALLVTMFYMLVYSKNRTVITGLESNMASLQTDLDGLRAIAAKLPEFESQSKRLQNQLLEISRKLPQEREIPGLLESISKAGQESGLQFELFKPRPEVKKEFYVEVPVDIVVKGPFHNVAAFLDQIVHLPRIVNITNFSFSSPKDEGNYVFVTGTGLATTYRYSEQS